MQGDYLDTPLISFSDGPNVARNFALGGPSRPSAGMGLIFTIEVERVTDTRSGHVRVRARRERDPAGRPQIQYFERSDQWTPRGDVLRCVVSDGGPEGEATVYIDDRELSLREFGRLLDVRRMGHAHRLRA